MKPGHPVRSGTAGVSPALPSKPMPSSDRVLARFRKLCLSFPETSETSSWGHPNFRVGKRTFATYEVIKGRPSFAFRLSEADVHVLLHQDQFFVTPYGRGPWVSVWADLPLNWRLITGLLQKSYRFVAPKRIRGRSDSTRVDSSR